MEEVLTYVCPFCDRQVRVGEPCPGCAKKKKPAAAKTRKSWQQDKTHDGLDLPDEEFDYDDFVAREFGGKPHRTLGVKWYWWLLGVALLILMVLLATGGMGALGMAESVRPAVSQSRSHMTMVGNPWVGCLESS